MALDPARDEARFWANTIPEPNSGCLLWLGAITATNGYGVCRVGSRKNGTRRQETTNRLACTYAHGPAPSPHHQALHRCDVKSCCEPRHLYWGTRKDNACDASLRGRFVGRSQAGACNGNVKLTEKLVRLIRESDLSNRLLAIALDISASHVGEIRRRKSWGHLP